MGKELRKGGIVLIVAVLFLLVVSVPSSYLVSIEYPAHSSENRMPAHTLFVMDIPGPPRPSVPENFTAIPGPDYVDLFWEDPYYDGGSPITNYYIYRMFITNDFDEDTSAPDFVLDADSFRYRDAGLTPNLRYLYVVQAVNENSRGYASPPEWAVPGATVPSSPTELRAESGGHQVNLTWMWPGSQGGTKILGYHVYRGLSPSSLTLLAHDSSTGFERHTDVNLSNGLEFYYCVSAYNYFGEGPRSTTVAAKAFWAPRNLSVSPIGVESCGPAVLNLSWDRPAENFTEVSFYKIYGVGPVIPVEGQNTTWTGVAEGGFGGWYIRISAIYKDGTEAFSEYIGVYGPYCEGCVSCYWGELIVILVFISGLVVVPLLIVMRKRH